jgi:Flp pilus assembly protein TadG
MLRGSSDMLRPDTFRPGRRAPVSFRRLARGAVAVRRFVRNASGVAAVEFGFIAPILLVMLLGAVEVTRAISIDRRFAVVTSTVADLVTRETQLTAADVNAMYQVAAQIMRPFEVTPLKLSIVPVMRINGNDRVYPSAANRPGYNGGGVHAKCASYSLSTSMLAANESVIVVEGEYRFTPLFAGFFVSAMNWTEKAFSKPRKSSSVNFGDASNTYSC